MRELERGKPVSFVGIGGGLKAFIAKQSLTGKGFLSGMNIDDLLFDIFSDYSSIYVLYLCLRVCWFA